MRRATEPAAAADSAMSSDPEERSDAHHKTNPRLRATLRDEGANNDIDIAFGSCVARSSAVPAAAPQSQLPRLRATLRDAGANNGTAACAAHLGFSLGSPTVLDTAFGGSWRHDRISCKRRSFLVL